MRSLFLIAPYPPSGNASVRHVPGLAVPLRSREAKGYRDVMRLAVLEQLGRFEPLEGELILRAHVLRPARRGDLDNALKVLQDSAQGLLYRNDSQIARLHVTRAVSYGPPRVLLGLEELHPVDAEAYPSWAMKVWGPVPPQLSPRLATPKTYTRKRKPKTDTPMRVTSSTYRPS